MLCRQISCRVLWNTNTMQYLYSFWVLSVLYEVQLDNQAQKLTTALYPSPYFKKVLPVLYPYQQLPFVYVVVNVSYLSVVFAFS